MSELKTENNNGTNGMAITGFVLAFFLPLIGLILSIVGLSQLKKKNQSGKGLAIAGIVISSVMMLLFIPIMLLLVVASFTDIQQKARDTERQTDIKAIHGQVEAYYAQTGNYPSPDEMNSSSFRNVNLQGLMDEALIDPLGTSPQLTSKPEVNMYSYEVRPIGCNNTNKSKLCTSYVLTSTLEGEVDGSTTFVKESLNL